jgi:tetratricopeptide (TPR) repeat protein
MESTSPSPRPSPGRPPVPLAGDPQRRPSASALAWHVWRLPAARYLAVFTAALVAFLARWAIHAGDTDLWYHLAAGRAIAQDGAIPSEAFASFLERPWLDYYWLFQLVVWAIHGVAGYGGLVLARAVLFLALAAAAIALLRPWRPPGAALRTAALVSVLLILLPRFASLRPQLVVLTLLPLVLVALERGGRWLLTLPVAALVWANVHGVSWPVLAMVLAAYGAELLLEAGRRQGPPAAIRGRLLALVLAAAAVLATPHGMALLPVPFTSLDFASRILDELGRVSPAAFAGLAVDRLVPGRQTLFNLLALMTLVALLEQLSHRRLRAAHVLLVAGGALLIGRGSRFVFEASLLALPLLAAWDPPPALSRRGWSRPVRVVLLALVAAIPFLTLWRWQWRGSFPLATENLPVGVSTFLERAGGGGTLFNDPDLAGYLEWRLVPRYQIFSDLQTPFLHSDVDSFLALGAFGDARVLRKVVARWQPDFLAVSAWETAARRAIDARLGYVPVAFDWTTVLYASRRSRPALAASYRLAAVDPYAAAGGRWPLRRGAPRARASSELSRLVAVDGDNGALRVALGRLELAGGRAAAALRHAQRAVAVAPRRPEPWRLEGDALVALGRYREAVDALAAARQRGGKPGPIGRQLWVCWTRLGEPGRAYRELSAVVDPLASGTTYLDLLALGETAARLGDRQAAERNLTFALWKAPGEEAQRRVAAALARLRATASAPYEAPRKSS